MATSYHVCNCFTVLIHTCLKSGERYIVKVLAIFFHKIYRIYGQVRTTPVSVDECWILSFQTVHTVWDVMTDLRIKSIAHTIRSQHAALVYGRRALQDARNTKIIKIMLDFSKKLWYTTVVWNQGESSAAPGTISPEHTLYERLILRRTKIWI